MSASSPDNGDLIQAPKSKKPLIGGIAVVAVVAIGGGIFALTQGGDDSASEMEKVTIGVANASEPYWSDFVDVAAEEGIDLEVENFSDYAQPNPALSEGELDVNQFQHIIYLADYNVKNDDDLVPIGSTATYPLGLYSSKYDEVSQIKDGETVVVPDDDTNQARGLIILESQGLITVKGGATPFSTVADVDTAKSKVEVKAIQADLIPTSLPDVAAAIVNNDFVLDAGLSFDDALAQDDPEDPKSLPYVNIFVARADDKDDETLNKLVDIYHSSDVVIQGVQEASGNTAAIVDLPQEKLQASLEETEAQIRDGQ
ncbi:MetQ/NlpA family ABC transporter substrate-binding protein [Nocardioides insulae]|uniref:MetQ/NlpA family ABC transporter substrate-binding protein n=1 Tax=Nocardioides insulae TaxID=394734 RepID=UPI0004293268|nr:MetQ/NlpA family ABC transporter substrate-binding protein [Nocardioides insulae]